MLVVVVNARRPLKLGRRREVVVIKAESMVGKSNRQQQHKDREYQRKGAKKKVRALVSFISVLVLWVVWCEGVRW